MFQFHALYGKNICNYQLVCDSDMNLQNKDSVSQCLHVLSSLRLIMQVALPQEQLCWIVFNGMHQHTVFLCIFQKARQMPDLLVTQLPRDLKCMHFTIESLFLNTCFSILVYPHK